MNILDGLLEEIRYSPSLSSWASLYVSGPKAFVSRSELNWHANRVSVWPQEGRTSLQMPMQVSKSFQSNKRLLFAASDGQPVPNSQDDSLIRDFVEDW